MPYIPTTVVSAGAGAGVVWDTYTPDLSATVTPPTLGSGSSQSGFFATSGEWVFVVVRILFGSSGVNPGSGTYVVSNPVDASTDFAALPNLTLGNGLLIDSGTTRRTVAVRLSGASTIVMQTDAANTSVAHNSPFTWAANDAIELQWAYQTV